MKKIISVGLFSLFILLLSFSAYSQDSTKSAKYIYKISPASNQPKEIKEVELPRKKNCVYSCETNPKSNQAIITIIKENGVVSKETYVLKEEKK